VPHADASDREKLPALADGICVRIADALRADVRAGIGRTVAKIDDLLESRREADRVLRAVAGTPGAGTVATADSVRSRVVVQYLQELAAIEPTLRAGKLDVLVEHD